ncbi:MAG: hypothetical protein EKE20_15280 [Candidatus Symbiopectobacterium sp. Dall1.0]|nr:hypothetical protein [Candidatus Symbiopectobacterium sp. Dall1.0]
MGRQTKNKVGRPSELAQSLEKAKAYLLGDYEKLGDVVPSIAGLACYLAVSRSSVYDWARQSNEFLYIVEGILALQENRLINKGLQGDFNSTIAKLMLTKHGYSDKQELTGKDGGAIQVETKPLSEIFKNG